MKITIVRVEIISGVQDQCRTPDGVVHEGPGCIYRAARHLIAHGVAPGTRMRAMRDGTTALSGTVSAFARQSWGGASRDPYSRPWTPHPNDVLPPALAKWWKSVQS